jgi:polyisoprenyl-phosphate glycosyltransferase
VNKNKAAYFPVFLSVVLVVRNEANSLREVVIAAAEVVANIVSDYELVIVDNASTDNSVLRLQELASESGLPNLQVYALTKEVDRDTAAWAGVENALGDYVGVFDPHEDDIAFIPNMLEEAVKGTDVVFATNLEQSAQSWRYRAAYALFNFIYKYFNGLHFSKEAPLCRLLSRTVINFVLQHPLPEISYRHLPATGGFTRCNLGYRSVRKSVINRSVRDGIDRGMRLLVSTTRAPMRIVTLLCLFGAIANLLYSIYVLWISFFKVGISPGWASLSLQQSGMFFLISLVLLILSEYIMHMVRMSSDGPSYHVAKEFTSAKLTRKERLNIEVAGNASNQKSMEN